MTSILLYWNHICVLHNQEKKFLTGLSSRLREEGIDLTVRYFGLGYPEHMSEYLAREDAVLPDMIVSADLEVFEDSRIFQKLKSSLYPARDWLPLKQGNALNVVDRGPGLLPFVSIPLVYYSRSQDCCAGRPIHQMPGLAFGGINNSAGKTLIKAVWSRYGREAAEHLIDGSCISDMPIGAFQQVRMGLMETALVPSLYALRADGKTRFWQEPAEGPMLIPSFFCARTTVPEPVARKLAGKILCRELCEFYETNGNLLSYPLHTAHTGKNHWSMEQLYFTPSGEWLESISPETFYQLYDKITGSRFREKNA